MDGIFVNASEFHPTGGKPARTIAAGTPFTFADGTSAAGDGTIQIRMGDETGTVRAADVVSSADDAAVSGLITAGSVPEVQDLTSPGAFADHHAATALALAQLPGERAGAEYLRNRLQLHLGLLESRLSSPSVIGRVAEAVGLYFASEEHSGDWPKLLRIWAKLPKATRKKGYALLPDPVGHVFTALVDAYVEESTSESGSGSGPGSGSEEDDPDLDQIILSSAYETAIEPFTLMVGSALNAETAAVCKPIVPEPTNLYATAKGLMVGLPRLQVPPGLVVHPLDAVLDGPADVPDAQLPAVVTLTLGEEPWLRGGPVADDVCQGELGDCYFLARLGAIAFHDPAQIKRIVRKVNGTYVVTFVRTFEHRNRSFRVPQRVELKAIFPHNDQKVLLGARPRVRCGDPVVRRRRTLGGDAYLETAYELETALWVPIVERAFAALAGTYGQYANEIPADGARPDDGYARIRDGSQSGEMIFSCLYGHRYRHTRSVQMRFLREAITGRPARLDLPSAELLNLLLMINDQREGTSPRLAIPTASVSWRVVATKLIGLGKEHKGELAPHFHTIGELLAPVVDAEADTFATLESRPEFQNACARVMETLLPLGRDDVWARQVVRLIAALAPPQITGRSRPYVYARHEYAVGAVHLVFGGPSPEPDYVTNPSLGSAPVNSESLARVLPTLDLAASTVGLSNPHHRNSPDLDGTLTAGADTGAFVLPLAEFLEFFTHMSYAVVGRHA